MDVRFPVLILFTEFQILGFIYTRLVYFIRECHQFQMKYLKPRVSNAARPADCMWPANAFCAGRHAFLELKIN